MSIHGKRTFLHRLPASSTFGRSGLAALFIPASERKGAILVPTSGFCFILLSCHFSLALSLILIFCLSERKHENTPSPPGTLNGWFD
jgi:hypothetical protein